MAKTVSKGHCYLCGKELTKTTAKRHVLTHEPEDDEAQECMLVKIEDKYDKNYWLYVDISLTATLKSLDTFLREIWLECCGHLSEFSYGPYHEEIGFTRKISSIPEGIVLDYEYDFGTSTDLKITFVEYTLRRKQKKAVRLLARNIAPDYRCGVCGKPAEYIDPEAYYDEENPFYCLDCLKAKGEDEEFALPVVNSPRMGVCGYCGEFDTYEFDPDKIGK